MQVMKTGAQPPSGAGGGKTVEALEQRLRQLRDEKQKALESHDRKRAQRLERQIRKLEEQLRRLRQSRHGRSGEPEEAPAQGAGRERQPLPEEAGRLLDEHI